MGKLSGKVAVITGGGQGVGLGIAQSFASAIHRGTIMFDNRSRPDGRGRDRASLGAAS